MTLRLLSAAFLLPSSLAMAAEPSAPFNGKDLSNWEAKGKAGSKWAVGEAVVSASNAGALEMLKSKPPRRVASLVKKQPPVH